MARNDQVTRVLKVIGLLEGSSSGLSVREIHARLEKNQVSCSLRSVYRDLEAIERAYFPVVREGSGDESRWRLNSMFSVSPNIQFSHRELLSLFIARKSLGIFRGSPIFEALHTFFDRIEKLLGPKAREGLMEFDQYLGFKLHPNWLSEVSQKILDTIHQACAEGHELEIEYRAVSGTNAGKLKKRRVGPSTIYFADAGAYLIAQDFNSGSYKTYAISRIHSAVMLDAPFDSDDVSAHELLKDGVGILGSGQVKDIVIKINEPIASYVSERQWHASQTIEPYLNGVLLKMRVRVNDELVRWILGLGASAEVLEPKDLRESIKCALLEINRIYKISL